MNAIGSDIDPVATARKRPDIKVTHYKWFIKTYCFFMGNFWLMKW